MRLIPVTISLLLLINLAQAQIKYRSYPVIGEDLIGSDCFSSNYSYPIPILSTDKNELYLSSEDGNFRVPCFLLHVPYPEDYFPDSIKLAQCVTNSGLPALAIPTLLQMDDIKKYKISNFCSDINNSECSSVKLVDLQGTSAAICVAKGIDNSYVSFTTADELKTIHTDDGLDIHLLNLDFRKELSNFLPFTISNGDQQGISVKGDYISNPKKGIFIFDWIVHTDFYSVNESTPKPSIFILRTSVNSKMNFKLLSYFDTSCDPVPLHCFRFLNTFINTNGKRYAINPDVQKNQLEVIELCLDKIECTIVCDTIFGVSAYRNQEYFSDYAIHPTFGLIEVRSLMKSLDKYKDDRPLTIFDNPISIPDLQLAKHDILSRDWSFLGFNFKNDSKEHPNKQRYSSQENYTRFQIIRHQKEYRDTISITHLNPQVPIDWYITSDGNIHVLTRSYLDFRNYHVSGPPLTSSHLPLQFLNSSLRLNGGFMNLISINLPSVPKINDTKTRKIKCSLQNPERLENHNRCLIQMEGYPMSSFDIGMYHSSQRWNTPLDTMNVDQSQITYIFIEGYVSSFMPEENFLQVNDGTYIDNVPSIFAAIDISIRAYLAMHYGIEISNTILK